MLCEKHQDSDLAITDLKVIPGFYLLNNVDAFIKSCVVGLKFVEEKSEFIVTSYSQIDASMRCVLAQTFMLFVIPMNL